MSCKVTAGDIHGLATVKLENDRVWALVTAGKGAELLEFGWKPLGINCLYRSGVPFEAYAGRDLSVNRLKSHTDLNLGGWTTVLPHRAKYKGLELKQENGGIAATIPWAYKITAPEGRNASVRCFADLPVVPMRVEKVFTLMDGASELVIDESVSFNGDEPVVFTWTEHAIFGGDFVDDGTTVSLPAGMAFDAWAHMAAPEKDISAFEHAVEAFPFKSGTYDLRCPLPAAYGGMEFIVFRDFPAGRAGLHSKKWGLSVSLWWDRERFPMMRSLYRADRGARVVGLEPADDMFSGFEHSLKHRTYTRMLPGENISTRFTLEFRPD